MQKWYGWPHLKCRHKITFSISVLFCFFLLFLAVLDLNDQDLPGEKMRNLDEIIFQFLSGSAVPEMKLKFFL